MSKENRVEEIIKEINEKIIPEISSKINYINNGGCGAFAYLFGKRLKELNISFKIRELEQYDPSDTLENMDTQEIIHPEDPYHSCSNFFTRVNTLDNNEKHIAPAEKNEIGWYHIEVELDNNNHHYLIDGEEIREIKNTNVGEVLQEQDIIASFIGENTKEILGGEIDFDMLGKMLDYDIWSNKFDRSQIPTLEKILENELI